MALTDVNLFRIDGTVGSIPSADIDVIKNAASASNNIVLNSDGTTTLTPNNIIKSGTSVASTSGTSIDFTGIPSWVKRVTVMFNGVSTNGTSAILVRIGSGSVTDSGYVSAAGRQAGSATVEASSTVGFVIAYGNAAQLLYLQLAVTSIGGNIYNSSHAGASSGVSATLQGGGTVTLSGTLDRIRITTVNGTDTFDAGSINILLEG
jgi:hypothetical protein